MNFIKAQNLKQNRNSNNTGPIYFEARMILYTLSVSGKKSSEQKEKFI